MKWTRLFSLFVAALLCLPAAAAPAPDSPVVLLSDIHFDPLPSSEHCAAAEGKAAVAALTEKPAEHWAKDDFQLQAPFALARDSTYALMESAFAAAHQAAPQARLVIVPGDLLAHSLRSRWEACLDHPDQARFTRFAASAVNFVLAELAANFPGAQIVPVLGNNDSDLGDYALPSPDFLRDVLPEWRQAARVGGVHSSANFSAFADAGYFSVPIAAWPLRVIALNSNVWSSKSNPAGGNATGDRELQWMQTALAEAQSAHDKVIVLGHIPPGLDAHATRTSDGKHIVSFYNDCGELGAKPGCRDYAHAVPALMKKFSSTVVMAIFGHTHQNEFRVIGKDASALPLEIVPSVSPIFQNNPAFLIAQADGNFQWRDVETWYLPLSENSRAWKREFDFDAVYGAAGWNAVSLEKLVHSLDGNNKLRADFFLRMGSGNSAVSVPARWQDAYICGLDHLTAETAVPCVAELQLDVPLP